MSNGSFKLGNIPFGRWRRYFTGPMWGSRRRVPPPEVDPVAEGTFHRQTRQFTAAQTIVRCFYAFALYYAVTQCADFAGLLKRINFSPLWPLAWMGLIPPGSRVPGIVAVEVTYLLGSVVGAFFSAWRPARVVVFLSMLEFFALRNSFGKIGHSTHLFVTVALVLVFLPSGWQKAVTSVPRRTRQETLTIFWLCQAAILLAYSMSGVSKLGCAIYQAGAGQINAFSPGALGAHIAQRFVQTNTQSALGSFIIGHPYLTWPMMPLPIYLELFSFWIVFRPAVQRWWAFWLIVFHVGTIFTLTITFPVSCLLLALFFFQSPFAPITVRWREVVGGLPLVCELLNLPSVARRWSELTGPGRSSTMTSSPLPPLAGEGRGGRF